jgi:hypothetical protein
MSLELPDEALWWTNVIQSVCFVLVHRGTLAQNIIADFPPAFVRGAFIIFAVQTFGPVGLVLGFAGCFVSHSLHNTNVFYANSLIRELQRR